MAIESKWVYGIVFLIIGLIVGAGLGYGLAPKPTAAGTTTVTVTSTHTTTKTVTAAGEEIPEKYRSIMAQLPDYYPRDYWKIIEAAEKEGEVLVYSIMSAENWAPVIEEFNKLYPFIKVTTLDLGSYEVFDRYLSEVAAGAPSADMIISAAPDVFPEFIKENAMTYVSPEAINYPTIFILDWKLYVFDATPSLMVYNKMLLPADKVPKGYADLVRLINEDPDFWKGKITTYDITKSAFGSNMAYFFIKRYGDQAWQWLKEIAKAEPVTYASSGTMCEKIATGEHLLGFFVSRMSLWPRLQKAPEIYGYIYPEEGVVVAMRAAMITKTAKHPNAAKLLLDFILSKRGQIAWSKGGFTPVRPDIVNEVDWSLEHLKREVGEDRIIYWEWAPEIRNPEFVKQFHDKYMAVLRGGG